MARSRVVFPVLVALLLALTGCSSAPQQADTSSPCAGAEGSYACQVYRYERVGM